MGRRFATERCPFAVRGLLRSADWCHALDSTGDPAARSTPGFTRRARLNDWPPTKDVGHTSAPCLVQALVRRRGVQERFSNS